jgi:hypothetical protein
MTANKTVYNFKPETTNGYQYNSLYFQTRNNHSLPIKQSIILNQRQPLAANTTVYNFKPETTIGCQ